MRLGQGAQQRANDAEQVMRSLKIHTAVQWSIAGGARRGRRYGFWVLNRFAVDAL